MPVPHLTIPSSDLKNSFIQAAHWVWERRETAKNAKLPFSEETVTETVLLDIATANPSEIIVTPFNKRQEGKIGADWEWLFYSRDRKRFLRLLVQAKVLDDREQDYAHVAREIGNTGVRQIDRFVQIANQRGVTAVYAFYNFLSDLSRIPNMGCNCACEKCWGCSVALADAVLSNLPDKSFDKLSLLSAPWVCLLCSDQKTQEDIVTRVGRRLQSLHRIMPEKDGVMYPSAPPLEQFIETEPPSYFGPIFARLRSETPLERDVMIEAVAAQNPEIDGVVLVTDKDR